LLQHHHSMGGRFAGTENKYNFQNLKPIQASAKRTLICNLHFFYIIIINIIIIIHGYRSSTLEQIHYRKWTDKLSFKHGLQI
jgi:hypothetical protein